MYVVNPEKIDISKLYLCSGVEAEWLIYEQHLPVFGKTKDGRFYFAKTDKLNMALEEMPFWLKVKKCIF